MKKILITLICAIALNVFGGRWDFLPDYLGEINGVKVPRSDFIREMDAQYNSAILSRQPPDKLLHQIAPKLVEGFIDREVLLILAAEDGFSADMNSARELMRKKLLSLPKAQAQSMAQSLQQQNMTLDDYIDRNLSNQFLRNNFVIEYWIEKKIMPKISVTQADVEKYYKDNQRNYIAPGDPADTIRASHILIRPRDESDEALEQARKKAKALAIALKKGANFEKMAEKYSDCPTGQYDKGALGVIRRDQMPEKFSDAAFALDSGEISGVVQTPLGFHIIRRDPSLYPKLRGLQEVRKAIEPLVKKKKSEEKINELIKKARRRLDVKVYYIPQVEAKEQK